MSVIEEIAAERRRQIEEEGWAPEHDDEHGNGELAQAAACYSEYAVFGDDMLIEMDEQNRPIPGGWPWSAEWWKPKDPRRDLIRAAALIVAEIERLDRKGIS